MSLRRLLAVALVAAGLAFSPLTAAFAATYPPARTTTAESSRITVFVNGPVLFRACGFRLGESILISLNGVPQKTVLPDSTGCVSQTYSFTSVGTDVITAFQSDPRTVTLFVTVVARPRRGELVPALPFTGFDTPAAGATALAALGGGALLVRAGRRRTRVAR